MMLYPALRTLIVATLLSAGAAQAQTVVLPTCDLPPDMKPNAFIGLACVLVGLGQIGGKTDVSLPGARSDGYVPPPPAYDATDPRPPAPGPSAPPARDFNTPTR